MFLTRHPNLQVELTQMNKEVVTIIQNLVRVSRGQIVTVNQGTILVAWNALISCPDMFDESLRQFSAYLDKYPEDYPTVKMIQRVEMIRDRLLAEASFRTSVQVVQQYNQELAI